MAEHMPANGRTRKPWVPQSNYSRLLLRPINSQRNAMQNRNDYSYGVRPLLIRGNDFRREIFAGTLDKIRRSVLPLLRVVASRSASNSWQQQRRSRCSRKLSDQSLTKLSRVRAGRG